MWSRASVVVVVVVVIVVIVFVLVRSGASLRWFIVSPTSACLSLSIKVFLRGVVIARR